MNIKYCISTLLLLSIPLFSMEKTFKKGFLIGKSLNTQQNTNAPQNNPSEFVVISKDSKKTYCTELNDTNPLFKNGSTLFHLYARYGSNLDPKRIQALFDKGMNVNGLDNNHNTPLIIAAIYNNFTIAKAFLEVGANPHKTNKFGYVACDFANMHAQDNHDDRLLTLLKSYGAQPGILSLYSDVEIRTTQETRNAINKLPETLQTEWQQLITHIEKFPTIVDLRTDQEVKAIANLIDFCGTHNIPLPFHKIPNENNVEKINSIK